MLRFLERYLAIDLSIKDIEQAISDASVELHGIRGDELRRLMNTKARTDRNQLQESLKDTAGGVVESPLTRSLALIATVSLTRLVMHRLLFVATPESVFMQRESLPKDTLKAYFGGCQDHFNLKSLIAKIGRERQDHHYLLNVHSDSCAHSIPTWCSGGDLDNDSHVFQSIVERVIHKDSSNIQIQHIDLLKSESSLRSSIDSWASNEKTDIFILVVDMQLQSSSNLVNFTRCYVEQASLKKSKRFVLLLHYPLSVKIPSYPALFLGKWQCLYLDGIGYRDFTSPHLSINDIFMSACLC